jgi:hypothetical protein
VSRGNRLGVGLTCAGAVLMVLAGCSGNADPATSLPEATSTPASPSARTSSGQDANGRVLAAYLAYWDAVIHAHRTANPADPVLAKHAAGAELTKVRQTVARNRIQQISIRGTVTHKPAVESVTGSAAVVADCYDISAWDPVNLRTGLPIDALEQGGTGRYRARYTLRAVAGTWVVSASSTSGGC